MKEDLRDLNGQPLFPTRFAETRSVDLSPLEDEAYSAVMDYVDEWYGTDALLAKSIYGKRAASSLIAARHTLQRRLSALSSDQAGHTASLSPKGFDSAGFAGADVDSDEAWETAEEAVVQTRSRAQQLAWGHQFVPPVASHPQPSQLQASIG